MAHFDLMREYSAQAPFKDRSQAQAFCERFAAVIPKHHVVRVIHTPQGYEVQQSYKVYDQGPL